MKHFILVIIFIFISAGVAIACAPEELPSPTPTDTVNPCEQIDGDYLPEICLTPTVEQEASPSAEPTVAETPPTSGGEGDHQSDHLSDGRHQAPDGLGCAAHECKDETGQVLSNQVGWK